MHLDKHHPRPIYLQLKEMLQSQIEQGCYYPHQKLPSERELCGKYDLSRMTARKALQVLITEGYAYTRLGKGTFVNDIANAGNGNGRSEPDHVICQAHWQDQLVEQLLSFDSVSAEQTIRRILAAQPLETVAIQLFPNVIRMLEKRWRSGKTNLVAQNYAVTMLKSQLIAMVNATACESGPKVLLACAPGDDHEIGLLLLALGLRRRGFRVIYLGTHINTAEFEDVVDIIQPQLICFSAATTPSAQTLTTFSREFQARPISKDFHFMFGGTAFSQQPALIDQVSGHYLGDTIEAAIKNIKDLRNLYATNED
jgi:DNA-binding transcriptional regulator YhcF (GntR family)